MGRALLGPILAERARCGRMNVKRARHSWYGRRAHGQWVGSMRGEAGVGWLPRRIVRESAAEA